ncbi:MAG: hypothetical protein Q7T55_17395 [Solirubrobacteraceae bacterium]|nr:hypothetical protein [Solirubrobacteraceae bacterium]
MFRLARLQPSALALPALAAVSIGLGLPASSQAQGCTGAPGASAIQQYCEAVPSADGGTDKPGGSSNGGSGGSGSDSSSNSGSSTGSSDGVSAKTSRSLNEAGADGAAVERLAGGSEATSSKGKSAPKAESVDPAESEATSDDGGVAAERVDGPSDPGGSPLKAATNAVASGPTTGSGLVWGLAGISILGVGAAVLFRRRGSETLVDTEDDA